MIESNSKYHMTDPDQTGETNSPKLESAHSLKQVVGRVGGAGLAALSISLLPQSETKASPPEQGVEQIQEDSPVIIVATPGAEPQIIPFDQLETEYFNTVREDINRGIDNLTNYAQGSGLNFNLDGDIEIIIPAQTNEEGIATPTAPAENGHISVLIVDYENKLGFLVPSDFEAGVSPWGYVAPFQNVEGFGDLETADWMVTADNHIVIVNSGNPVSFEGSLDPSGFVSWAQGAEVAPVANVVDLTSWTSAVENLPDAEFLAGYQWQPGDVVDVVPTGIGAADEVGEHWRLDVTRTGVTRSNLPVTEMEWGGYVRPLEIEMKADQRPDVDYNYFVIHPIYLGKNAIQTEINGVQSTVYYIAFILPSQDGQNDIIAQMFAPENHLISSNGGGGDILPTPASEVFGQIDEILRPGMQFTIQSAQLPNLAPQSYAEWKGVDCSQDAVCQQIAYAHDPANGTNPEILWNWWQNGELPTDTDGIVTQNGIVTFGAFTGLHMVRPPGTVYQFS